MMLFAQLNKKPLLLSQFPFPVKMRGLRNKSKFLFEGLGLRAVVAAMKCRYTVKDKYFNSSDKNMKLKIKTLLIITGTFLIL